MPALAARGHEGVAATRDPARLRVPRGWTVAARDRVLRDGAGTIDCVVHLEVKQHVLNPSAADLADFRRVNEEGTQAWLDWCGRCGVARFVHLSSIKAVRPRPHAPTDETAAGPHDSPYGASKWAAENRVRAWAAAAPDRSALILRPAVIYGAGGAGNMTAMVEAIRRGRFFLVGRNDNLKSLVSLPNATAAIAWLIARVPAAGSEVFNLSDERTLSVREIDAVLRAELGKGGSSPTLPVTVARAAAWLGDQVHRVTGRVAPINSSRLAALLEHTHFPSTKLAAAGFKHPEGAEAGLREFARATARASSAGFQPAPEKGRQETGATDAGGQSR